jgi:hypothetical protein
MSALELYDWLLRIINFFRAEKVHDTRYDQLFKKSTIQKTIAKTSSST